MFEEYRREMDDVRLSEQQKEQLAALMAAQPVRTARRAGRTFLVAAAVCALCAVSALALSPTLRQMLEAAQGDYTQYAAPVEACVVKNGIEIRVISALADNTKVVVYAEARDLEGNRLSGEMEVVGVVQPETFAQGIGISSCTNSGRCIGYDSETGTALLEITTWGLIPGEDTQLELVIPSLSAGGEPLGEHTWHIPFDPERQTVRSIPLSGSINGVPLLRLELSTLGAALYSNGLGGVGRDLVVYCADGSILHPVCGGGGGTQGIEGPVSQYWSFEEPVDPAEVIGISIQYWYIPIQADGTAGPGYWLTELPE